MRLSIPYYIAAATVCCSVNVARAGIVGDNLLNDPGFDDPIENPDRLNMNQGNGYGNLELVGQTSPGGVVIQPLTYWELVVQEDTELEDGTTLTTYPNTIYYTPPNSNVSKVSSSSRESKNQRIAFHAKAPAGAANVVYVPKRLRQKVTVPQAGTYQISFWHGPGGTRGSNWADSKMTIEVGGQAVFSRTFQHIVRSDSTRDDWKRVWSEPFQLEAGDYDLDIYTEQAEPCQSSATAVDTIDDMQFGLFERQIEVEVANGTVQGYGEPIAITTGETHTLSVRPDDGYYFVGWVGDGITEENRLANPLTITVPEGDGDIRLSAKVIASDANLLANADFELVHGGLEGNVWLNRVRDFYNATYPYAAFADWSATGPGNGYGGVCWALLGGTPVGGSTSDNSWELCLLAPVGAEVGNGLEQTFCAPVDGHYTLTINMRSLNYANYTSGQRIPIYLDGKEAVVVERELNTTFTEETVTLKGLKAGFHTLKLMAGTTLGETGAATFLNNLSLQLSEPLAAGTLILIR